MKKIGLSLLICMFTLLLGGCTGNAGSAPVEDSSEVVSDESEVATGEEKHFWVNR